MDYTFNTIDWILLISLSVALVCSMIISFEVYYLKNHHYKKTFSAWQMPMILAMLIDIYLIL